LPLVTLPRAGAPGTVAGVTAVEAVENALVPTEFVAEILKVYAVPLVRPVTVSGELVRVVDQLVQFEPASDEYCNSYALIGAPPFAGATHETAAEALPRVTVGAEGVVGATGALEVETRVMVLAEVRP
jgi:hypothetical protein